MVGPERTRWDVNRQKKKGLGTAAPRCSECGRLSVLDPCRECAPDEPEPEVPASLF